MPSYVATAFADNFRLAKSKIITDPDADTYDMIQIPKMAFLKDVWLYVQEAGSATDVTLGMKGNGAVADVDYFMTATESDVGNTGWKRAYLQTGAGVDLNNIPFPGLWFTGGAGMITLTFGTTLTTGIFFVMADYTIIY